MHVIFLSFKLSQASIFKESFAKVRCVPDATGKCRSDALTELRGHRQMRKEHGISEVAETAAEKAYGRHPIVRRLHSRIRVALMMQPFGDDDLPEIDDEGASTASDTASWRNEFKVPKGMTANKVATGCPWRLGACLATTTP